MPSKRNVYDHRLRELICSTATCEHAVMRAVQLAGAIAALGVEEDAEDERGAS